MKIYLTVRAGAKRRNIIKIDEKNFKIYTSAPAQDNKANEDIIFMLAEYFGLSKSQVAIIAGLQSKHKIVELT